MQRLTTSKKVELIIKEQGRKKTWLAKELGITRQKLDSNLSDNFWTVGDIIKLKSLKLI